MPRGFLRRSLGSGATTYLLIAAALLTAGGIWWQRSAPNPTGDLSVTAPPSSGALPARNSTDDMSDGARPLFTDVTDESGLGFVHVNGARGEYWIVEEMGPGAAFLDYDGDSDLDVYLVQSGVCGTDNAQHRNRLYRNDGAGRFEDVSAGSGADIPGYGMGCVAADYDNDGDVDLYVTRIGTDVLLRNDGRGVFTDATAEAGLGDDGFATGAAFLDYDRDGHLDLYVTRYIAWSPARERECYDLNGVRDYCGPVMYESPMHDILYRSTGDGRFENVTEAAGISVAAGNGLGVLCSDLTGDGWIDIYVANDQSPTFFWVNQGNGTFVEDAALRGCAFNGDGMMIAGMGTAAADFDFDGDDDVLVTNIHQQVHLCLRNQGGYFEDISYGWGFGGWGVPYTGFGVGVFDQDHDGHWDCFVGNGAVNRLPEPYLSGHAYAEPNQFARSDARGRFTDATEAASLPGDRIGMSRAVVLGDYDHDGDLDILVTNCGGRAQLLRNDNATGLAWSMLDLRPRGQARHALNAVVEIDAGGGRYRREVRPHMGYLGSHDPRVHVGLGTATVIDRMTVTWPDRSVETWSELPVNRHLSLRQGESPQSASADVVD